MRWAGPCSTNGEKRNAYRLLVGKPEGKRPLGHSSYRSRSTKIKSATEMYPLKEEHRLRVFENRVLRRIFGPKRDEVTGEWRKLHNEELRDLYSSLSIVRIIKSRRMRWAGHVAQMGIRGTRIDYWWESQRERDH
jgi:hypothetical protein